MHDSGLFLEYEIAYRRERMREAGRGTRTGRGRWPWPTRPARRRSR